MAVHGNDLVREARKRAGLTQRELAEKAGTTQSAIARLESGRTRPAFDDVLRLVRLCRMDLDITLSEHDGSDWSQARRNFSSSPGERAQHMVDFGHRARELMPDHVRRAWPDLDPAPILTSLVDRAVEFVVIGGIASSAYGSILPTYDVDIVPRPGSDNLDRLSSALQALASDSGPSASVGVQSFKTPHGVLEVSFTPAGTLGYQDLIREAHPVRLFGVVVSVASLADVIRIKQAANGDMDRRVLPVLREILANRDLDTK